MRKDTFFLNSVNVCTRSHLCLVSRVALLVLVLEVEEDDPREESHNADVCEGGARGGVVLIVLTLLLLHDVVGGLEGGELFAEVVLEDHPLHGGAEEEFSREEGRGEEGGRSQAGQTGCYDLWDAHLED